MNNENKLTSVKNPILNLFIVWCLNEENLKRFSFRRVVTNIFICIFFLCMLWSPSLLIAQELPAIQSYDKMDYGAQNQNWDLHQDMHGLIYVANTGGLLRYDGYSWIKFPNVTDHIIRTVCTDSSGRIFIGGFETFGYFKLNADHRYEYINAIDSSTLELMDGEEIWNIVSTPLGMFFQSFSKLFKYADDAIELIDAPKNMMYVQYMNNVLLIPSTIEGLFTYPQANKNPIVPFESLIRSPIACLLPHTQSGILIGTKDDGIYHLHKEKLIPWKSAVNKELKQFQLNKAIALSNGMLAFGTIQNGLYISDTNGKIVFHFNTRNGLQNNTVLDLIEDVDGNIWCGLDRGVDHILLSSPLRYYRGTDGELGSVYAACLFHNRLYLGSNQGIFYFELNSADPDNLHFVTGSQGQVWDLQVLENDLICAHNKGVFHVTDDQFIPINKSFGAFEIHDAEIAVDSYLIGSYRGLHMLTKNDNNHWITSKIQFPKGSDTKPIRQIIVQGDQIHLAHSYKGLTTLQKQASEFTVRQSASSFNHIKNRVTTIGKQTLLVNKLGVFTKNENQADWIQMDTIQGREFQPGLIQIIALAPNRVFLIYEKYLDYWNGINWIKLNIQLITGQEQIIQLDSNRILFCQDDGYILLHTALDILEKKDKKPIITRLETSRQVIEDPFKSTSMQAIVLAPADNDMIFSFTVPSFDNTAPMSYRLDGYDKTWSPVLQIHTKEYTNIPAGSYKFQIRNESFDTVDFSFVIQPYWFNTIWFKIVCLLSGLLVFYLLRRWRLKSWREIEAQKLTKQLRDHEERMIRTQNQNLQEQLNLKSRQIADTAMNLIRKNEILLNIKEKLIKQSDNKDNEIDKIVRSIDFQLSNEEDWLIFESNFNQLHHDFFQRLKKEYKELTPGDLRLAAYLKMNLTSKEIAPLLNITIRGVENKRYRLRKKMDLGSESNLNEHLMSY